MLIEAHPDAFEDLKLKNRKTWQLGNCLSTQNTPQIVNFDAAGLIGGIIHDGKRPAGPEDNKMSENIQMGGMNFVLEGAYRGFDYERRDVKVLCFPFYSILMALGNPTVHYFR